MLKNVVEQSSTVPNSQSITYKEYIIHTLGLTLSTPGLVFTDVGCFALIKLFYA